MNRRDLIGVLGGVVAGGVGAARVAEAAEAEADKHGATAEVTPGAGFHLHLCAFHIAKKNPSFVVEAHHYCSPVNDELHQCVIYDKAEKGGRILGVEYIISDAAYQKLPDAEKKYYHPHAYEISSGMLFCPGMAAETEDKTLGGLITSWGKTWHTWPDPSTAFPMGEPLLMWSATKDGMVSQEALDERDKKYHIDTAAIRKRRSVFGPVPQVDPPKSIDDLGRRYTNEGPDVPPSAK